MKNATSCDVPLFQNTYEHLPHGTFHVPRNRVWEAVFESQVQTPLSAAMSHSKPFIGRLNHGPAFPTPISKKAAYNKNRIQLDQAGGST